MRDRRAIQFFQYDESDADEIAPSLRRNAGPRKVAPEPETSPRWRAWYAMSDEDEEGLAAL